MASKIAVYSVCIVSQAYSGAETCHRRHNPQSLPSLRTHKDALIKPPSSPSSRPSPYNCSFPCPSPAPSPRQAHWADCQSNSDGSPTHRALAPRLPRTMPPSHRASLAPRRPRVAPPSRPPPSRPAPTSRLRISPVPPSPCATPYRPPQKVPSGTPARSRRR